MPSRRRHPRRHSTLLVSLAAATVVVTSACGTSADPGGTDTTGAPGTGPLAGSWTLVSFAGPSGPAPAVADAAPATLTFGAPPALAGTTGCNGFSGTYTAAGNSMSISVGPMTQRACTSPAATAQERAVLDGLGRVATASVAGEQLTLTDAGGHTLFGYRRAASGLAGTRWSASSVNNGRGAVESTALTPNLGAAFGTDSRVTGSGGCNDFNAAYTEGPGTLSISALASTKKACSAEVDALEQQYFTALQASTAYDVTGDTLTLRDDKGAMQVVFNRAP